MPRRAEFMQDEYKLYAQSDGPDSHSDDLSGEIDDDFSEDEVEEVSINLSSLDDEDEGGHDDDLEESEPVVIAVVQAPAPPPVTKAPAKKAAPKKAVKKAAPA